MVLKIIYSIEKDINDTLIFLIIDENNNNSLRVYKYKEQQQFEIIEINEKAHEKNIYSCVELENGIIASGGNDNLIRLWKSNII